MMTTGPQSSFAWCRLPVLVAALSSFAAAPVPAQSASRIAVTDVAKDPGGTRLARLTAPASLVVTRSRSGWREIRLEGWIASRLLKRDLRDGYDVSVTTEDARLRAAPGGKEVGRLAEGMLLRRLETRGSWSRVGRNVWVPARAVAGARAAVARAPADADKPQAYQAPPRGGPVSTSSAQLRDSLAASAEPMAVSRSTALVSAPGAAPVGTLGQGAQLRVLSNTGGWSRVQLEGWVRSDDLTPSDAAAAGVTAAEVRANPARYVGKEVEWRVQYISTSSADELRPEMPPGQPYMLARGPLPEPGFVYVMISRDDSARVAGLPALAELTIRAKVRAARSKFLATPVVELVSILAPAPSR